MAGRSLRCGVAAARGGGLEGAGAGVWRAPAMGGLPLARAGPPGGGGVRGPGHGEGELHAPLGPRLPCAGADDEGGD